MLRLGAHSAEVTIIHTPLEPWTAPETAESKPQAASLTDTHLLIKNNIVSAPLNNSEDKGLLKQV